MENIAQVQVTDMKKIHFFPILCFILIGNYNYTKCEKNTKPQKENLYRKEMKNLLMGDKIWIKTGKRL